MNRMACPFCYTQYQGPPYHCYKCGRRLEDYWEWDINTVYVLGLVILAVLGSAVGILIHLYWK